MSWRLIATLLLAPCVAVAAGFVGGWEAKPPPPKPFPNNEQLTIAATTLTAVLLIERHEPLDGPPTFHRCRRTVNPPGGFACLFGVNYTDETTAEWELVVNKGNIPVGVREKKLPRAPRA